jgi:hypothetical protein
MEPNLNIEHLTVFNRVDRTFIAVESALSIIHAHFSPFKLRVENIADDEMQIELFPRDVADFFTNHDMDIILATIQNVNPNCVWKGWRVKTRLHLDGSPQSWKIIIVVRLTDV